MTLDRRQVFAEAAEKLVGCPFRLHGRKPASGLDCVGLVLCALDNAGLHAVAPPHYGLRNASCERQFATIPANGFAPVKARIECGDLLVVHPGPAQWHLLVVTSANHFVHAHAGLRKVVRSPLPAPWSIEQRWRLAAPNIQP